MGDIEHYARLRAFVVAYADWHTTADLNRLSGEARELLETTPDADPHQGAVEAADRYIEHLQAERHGACRRQTGPGSYECGYRLDWLAARGQ